MKKIIIVTDGNVLRAFRMDLERSMSGAVCHSSEIPQTPHQIHPGAPKWDRYGPCLEVRHKRFPTVDWNGTHETNCRRGHASPDALEENELKTLADRVSRIVLDEGAVIWNLVAPRDVLPRLQATLHPEARARLSSLVVDDLVTITLAEIDARFQSPQKTSDQPNVDEAPAPAGSPSGR